MMGKPKHALRGFAGPTLPSMIPKEQLRPDVEARRPYSSSATSASRSSASTWIGAMISLSAFFQASSGCAKIAHGEKQRFFLIDWCLLRVGAAGAGSLARTSTSFQRGAAITTTPITIAVITLRETMRNPAPSETSRARTKRAGSPRGPSTAGMCRAR